MKHIETSTKKRIKSKKEISTKNTKTSIQKLENDEIDKNETEKEIVET